MIVLLPYESAVEQIHILEESLPMENRTAKPSSDIKQMYDEERDQYNTRGYVRHCSRVARTEGHLVLGVTGVDLFSAGHDFVFGSAQVGGHGGVISIYRLGEGKELEERMLKEAVHEIGHIVGLTHCDDPLCVMHLSNTLAETDRKNAWFCSECEKEYEERKLERAD